MRSNTSDSLAFFLVSFGALLATVSCSDANGSHLSDQSAPALIRFNMNDSTVSEFIGEFDGDSWVLYNGKEAIALQPANDTLWRVPVFSGSWSLTTDHTKSVYTGRWVDSLRHSGDGDYSVPLSISLNEKPEVNRGYDSTPRKGTWDVWFNEERLGLADAQLDINHQDDRLSATMRTATGDYRYLTGTCVNHKLRLQTFDGAHLYLFTATYSNGSWQDGMFYSGNHYQTPWVGQRASPLHNENPMEILHVSDADLTAAFINRSGQNDTVSLVSDSLIVVDILGTWCPNCMDEVRLLESLKTPSARFISLAFERDTTARLAYKRLDGFASELQMDWNVYWGGKASKQVAAKAFPFLDRVISFPTTLFIRGNQVVVHSGFNGPATGSYYTSERQHFVDQLSGFTSLGNH